MHGNNYIRTSGNFLAHFFGGGRQTKSDESEDDTCIGVKLGSVGLLVSPNSLLLLLLIPPGVVLVLSLVLLLPNA